MKIKKNVWALQIIIFVIICITGCESDNNKPNMDFSYPLTVGNNWQYDMFWTIDFDSLATSNGLIDTTYYSTGLVEIITNEIIFDSLEVYNFATTITENDNIRAGNEYFNNKNNCLFSYGYINSSMITPKSHKKIAFIIFDDKKFKNIREVFNYLEKGINENEYAKNDSIYYDPVKCLEYPLEEDKHWMYRTPNNPFRIDKTIIGQENIDVPAGQFNCWKIQWTYPESSWNDDIEFYDFISKYGLVKRVFEFKNSECYGEDGNFIGYFDSKEEKYLTDYQINN